MHVHDEPVGADRYGGASQRVDQMAVA